MRLLVNENVARAVVLALRGRGHDVAWVREDAPGSPDERVLESARRDRRVLVTFDKDFGELAFRRGLPSESGIVLLRISVPSPSGMADMVVRAIESRDDWSGHFSVVEDDRIRMTRLPS